MRRLLVRADANGQIGLGHVLRTVAVADELARTGTRITYLCHSLSPWAEAQLRTRGYTIQKLKLPEDDQIADADATRAAVRALTPDAILLDHYGLTGPWVDLVKGETDLFIAAFDDLAQDPRDVDLLVDTSPGRTVSAYAGLIPEEALCLTGPRYAALRPEFAMARRATHARSGAVQVAISMGGVDPSGATLACLDALDGRKDIALTVLLSSDAKTLDVTRARAARMTTPTRLLLDRTDMATVLSAVDLVIGAGGSSALERCALGLPTVLAVLADNQAQNAAQLAKAGAAIVLPDLAPTSILHALEPLLTDPDARAQMAQNAARLCDGMGSARVAAALLGQASNVRLRTAALDDLEVVYDWQSVPGAREFARNPHVPSRDEHHAWFHNRLTRCAQDPFYIIETGGVPSGFVRLDTTDGAQGWEVSVLVSQAMQGRGLARNALGLLRLSHPEPNLFAEVRPDNAASQNLFARAGYQRIDDSHFVSRGWIEIVKGQDHED